MTTTTALTEAERTYKRGYTCRLCGCALYDGYPFTVCDDCWPKTKADHAPPGTPRPGAGAAATWVVECVLLCRQLAGLRTFGALAELSTRASILVREITDADLAVLADPAAGERARTIERVLDAARDTRHTTNTMHEGATGDDYEVSRWVIDALWAALDELDAAAPDGGDGGR